MEGCDGEEEPKVKVGICWQLSDGRYISGKDGDFIEQIVEDLQSFNEKSIRHRDASDVYASLNPTIVLAEMPQLIRMNLNIFVLVFPPFNNFHRFLIHNLVEENFKGLRTFSIGQSLNRRTVVCHKEDSSIKNRIADDGGSDTCGGMGIETHHASEPDVATALHSGQRKKARMLPDVAIYRPPALRRTSQGATAAAVAADRTVPTAERNLKQSKQRRPDIAVYVPRALRGAPLRNASTTPPAAVKDLPVEGAQSGEGPSSAEAASPAASPCRHETPSAADCGTAHEEGGLALFSPGGTTGDALEHPCGEAMAQGRHVGCPRGTGVSVGGDSGVGHLGEDVGPLAADDGAARLERELLDEVVAAVGRVSVVERPRLDYGPYRMDEAHSLAELSHVVEVFGFPAEFKTHDLIAILSPYGGGGFEIKWVDDTHALAVFGSAFVAADVLSLRHPMLKACALDEASAASRAKARKMCESLKVPYRPRPETCAALAQRLITGALGVQHRQSKAEREEERRLLREAREKRRSAARERDAAWEGTITGSLH